MTHSKAHYLRYPAISTPNWGERHSIFSKTQTRYEAHVIPYGPPLKAKKSRSGEIHPPTQMAAVDSVFAGSRRTPDGPDGQRGRRWVLPASLYLCVESAFDSQRLPRTERDEIFVFSRLMARWEVLGGYSIGKWTPHSTARTFAVGFIENLVLTG